MNGITELAKLLKERENSDGYSPMFGTVIELPNTKIRISDKVILTDSHITLCINLKEQNADGAYINLEWYNINRVDKHPKIWYNKSERGKENVKVQQRI